MQRFQHDLLQARRIQRSLLPQVPRGHPPLRVAVEYHPAYEVGGDLYQWLWRDPRQFVCVVGDVSGKGIPAALLMSRLTAEFLRAAGERPLPSQILETLNLRVTALDRAESFVTAICLTLDLEEGRLTIANAGHPPALRARGGGDVEWIGAASGAPLGAVEQESYEDRTYDLRQGDTLLLLTDGVTEALELRGCDPAARLRALTAGGAPADSASLASSLYAEVADERFDDSTIVALQLDDEGSS